MITHAERMVLAAHLMRLSREVLIANTEKDLISLGDDLQAAGLVARGEQDLVDILTLGEKADLARLKLRH